MKKLLISIIGALTVCSAFAVGENIATSKAFVDAGAQQKQDTIPANDGTAQVLTNTGTPGEIGTKNIYDSTGAYATQTDSLVTAGQFNTAVQNAIDTEFECIAWRDPNDHSSDCMLVQIRGVTDSPSGKNLLEPSFMDNSTYGPITVNGYSYRAARVLPTENGKTYTLSANLTYTGGFYYYIHKVLSNGTTSSPCPYMWYNNDNNIQVHPCTFTASDNAEYVVFWADDDYSKSHLTISDYQMEEGSTATAYEPYQNLYLPSGN